MMDYGILDFIGLSKFGLKKDAFSYPLKNEDISFMEIKSPLGAKKILPYFKANHEKLKDYYSLKDIRKLDNYARIVLLLSAELLKNLNDEEKVEVGIVLGTSFGSFKTNCDFLDTIIFQGFEGASPMLFIGTVHNSPLAPLGMFKGVRGPSYCISNFETTFKSSLFLSEILLNLNICNKVLLIFADDVSQLLLYGIGIVFGIDEKDIKKIPQEGGCGFLLGRGDYILPINEINDLISKGKRNYENYGFTYFPEAFELLIHLNNYDSMKMFLTKG